MNTETADVPRKASTRRRSSTGQGRPSSLTLPAVLIGVVLVAMSISGAAVALPSIGHDLDATGAALNWVVAGYNLAFAAMTLVAGTTADRIGRRRVFMGAAVTFAIGCVITAATSDIVVADLARVVSGIGGAGIMAAGGAILASTYEGNARNRAFALMGTMAGVGIAIGPTLSGLLIGLVGWRGSFVMFAVAAALVASGASRVRESRGAGGSTDWLGSTVFIVSLSALMFAVIEAPTVGWTDVRIVLAFGAGTMLLAVFGLIQRRSSSPVLAPELAVNRGFMGWSLATLTTSIGFLGALVFLPTYLQSATGMSPLAAGMAMLLLTAPVLVAPMTAGALVNRGASARTLIVIALALVAIGNLSLILLGPDNTVAVIALPLLMIGVGMGMSFGITDAQAMSLVAPEMVGMAAGFLNTLRGAAEAMVIAVFGASLLGLLSHRLADPTRAVEVTAGNLTTGSSTEIAALTWSWQMTQLGIGTLCMVLTVVVVFMLYRRPAATAARESDE